MPDPVDHQPFGKSVPTSAAGGPAGSATSPHTHSGSKSFYVISGELTQKTPSGVIELGAGESMVNHGDGEPMIVSNNGSGDLKELALFVVDASELFSSPVTLDLRQTPVTQRLPGRATRSTRQGGRRLILGGLLTPRYRLSACGLSQK